MNEIVPLLELIGKMHLCFSRRGRKSLAAIVIVTLFLLNLNGALAAEGGSAWHGPPSATTPLSLASIGDRVWHDENGNGDQNENFGVPEPGFDGVDVYLYSSDFDGRFEPGGDDALLYMTTTISGTSQMPDGWPDGIYGFDMSLLGPGEYWVWVDESTLPNPGVDDMVWYCTTQNNPQRVTYTGSDNFSIDFGYEPLACPVPPGPIWQCWLPLVHR
jgi:hypothetical protein